MRVPLLVEASPLELELQAFVIFRGQDESTDLCLLPRPDTPGLGDADERHGTRREESRAGKEGANV